MLKHTHWKLRGWIWILLGKVEGSIQEQILFICGSNTYKQVHIWKTYAFLNDLYHPWNKDIKRLLCKNYSNHLAWFFMHVTHTIHLWALFRNLLPARMNCIVFRSSRAIGLGRGKGAGEQLPSTSPPHNGRPLFIFITGLDYKKWSDEVWSLNHSGIL